MGQSQTLQPQLFVLDQGLFGGQTRLKVHHRAGVRRRIERLAQNLKPRQPLVGGGGDSFAERQIAGGAGARTLKRLEIIAIRLWYLAGCRGVDAGLGANGVCPCSQGAERR